MAGAHPQTYIYIYTCIYVHMYTLQLLVENNVHIMKRAFAYTVPNVWNNRPIGIKSSTFCQTIKCHPKTHFLSLAHYC